MCEEADAHDVCDFLGAIDNIPLTEEVKVLKVSSLHLNQEEAINFRRIARNLSSQRNMPLAFWSNSGGGVHCGFFFERCDTFDRLIEWLDDECSLVDKREFRRLLNFLYELDPDEKYELYWLS